MKLYHYTSHLHLPYILKEGLTMGDVPLTPHMPFGEATGVWLTTSKERKGQTWAGTRGATCFVDKTAIRLTVDIPEVHLAPLQKWDEYAHQHGIAPSWKKALDESGGGDDEACQWHIYEGIVLRKWIVQVKDLKPQTYSTAQRRFFVEHHKVNRLLLRVKVAPEAAQTNQLPLAA